MQNPNTFLTHLSDVSQIRVSGADARSFLQGQLSTNIENLTAIHSQLSSWSNSKGRVVVVPRVFMWGTHIYLSVPASMTTAFLKRLGMYILRSKVKLEDAYDFPSRLGLVGDNAPELLRQVGIPVPQQTNDVTATADIQTIRLHGTTPRFVFHGEADVVSLLEHDLKRHGVTEKSSDAWALSKIEAGEPTVYPETTEHFVAQMLGLDQLGAIDFKKGCYIGQEVIARAHYRGAVKRHMRRASLNTIAELRPGMELHAKGSDTPVAEIVDTRRDAGGIWQMLLVLQDESQGVELMHAKSGAAVSLD